MTTDGQLAELDALWGDEVKVLEWLGRLTAQQAQSDRGARLLGLALAPTSGAWPVARWDAVLENANLGPVWVLAHSGQFVGTMTRGDLLAFFEALEPYAVKSAGFAGELLRLAADLGSRLNVGRQLSWPLWRYVAVGIAGRLELQWTVTQEQLRSPDALGAGEAEVAVEVWEAIMGTAHLCESLDEFAADELATSPFMVAFPDSASVRVLERAFPQPLLPDELLMAPYLDGIVEQGEGSALLVLKQWSDALVRAGVVPTWGLLWWGFGSVPAGARLGDVARLTVEALAPARRAALQSRAGSAARAGVPPSPAGWSR